MQRQDHQHSTMGASAVFHGLDRFNPLLEDIRGRLGDQWTFYEECIDGVLYATARQQDTTAWFEQMQLLVEGTHEVRFSHEGILFLLREMGIHTPRQQSRGEAEGATLGMYPSPLISPRKESFPSASSPFNKNNSHNNNNNNNNMASEPLRLPSSMIPLLSLRPLLPSTASTPSVSVWTPPRAQTPRTQQQQPQQRQQQQQQQQQRQKQPVILRDHVLPFDFGTSVLPGLTFPENFRDYHCPRDEIILTENYVPTPPSPLRKTSKDPVLFSSPTLKTNIDEFFGYTVQRCGDDRHSSDSDWQVPFELPYDPEENDLVAWKQRSEGRTDGERHEMKAKFDIWPPRSSHPDSEM